MSYRAAAEAAGVSLGTVQRIAATLRPFVVDGAQSGVRREAPQADTIRSANPLLTQALGRYHL